MREIKFRVWSIKGKTMWYINKQTKLSLEGDSWQVRDDVIGNRFRCSWHEDEKGILMQYTGLKDKNGKEIYEGDIIQRGTTVSDIVFENCGFKLRKGNSVCDVIKPFEVIGNIYENPELLADKGIK